MENQEYALYSQKTGQLIAHLGPGGRLTNCQNAAACAQIQALLQRDLVIREDLPGSRTEAEGDDYDPFPEEQMCYFNLVTLRPNDPQYIAAFIRRLPFISNYEARPLDR